MKAILVLSLTIVGCIKHPTPAPSLPIAFRVTDSNGNVIANMENRGSGWQEVKH